MNPDLLILCATSVETAPFLKKYPAAHETFTRTGARIKIGTIGSRSYQLVITGAGVFNTAHALTAVLESGTPRLMLQTGIAGLFRQTGLAIGDVAVATRVQYVHTGVTADTQKKDPLPFDLISGNQKTRQGIYLISSDLVQECQGCLEAEFKNDGAKVAKGACLTVSCITGTDKRAHSIYKDFSPVMEAMEGAASAHVASLYRIPFLEVRSASNIVGERDKSKWDIQAAAGRLSKICRAVSCLDPTGLLAAT